VEPPPPGSSPARRLPKLRSRRWAVAAAVVAALLLSGCQLPAFGAYRGSTAQGQDAFKLWQLFFIAGAAVFLLVLFLIVWSVFRYRRRSDAIPPQTQYHTVFEITYTVVPILLVIVLFVFTFVTENEVDALSTGGQLTVNVTAFQWGWEFQYPAYDVEVLGVETEDPTMELPANETVHVFLRSRDVVHGFYVPQFNFSRYALPGVTNQFDLNVLHTGTYRGQCTNFCGLYHSLMIFQVKAVTPSEFKAWVQQEQSSSGVVGSIATARRQARQHPVTQGSSP
jgi:cytochrome c oxidase subunit 2